MFIGIEDVVANALIVIIERNENKSIRRVSLPALVEYGTVVVRQMQENGETAILLVSNYYTSEAIRNYSDFFELQTIDGIEYIQLRSEKTVSDLRNRFRAYLSISALLAFTSENSIGVLLGLSS